MAPGPTAAAGWLVPGKTHHTDAEAKKPRRPAGARLALRSVQRSARIPNSPPAPIMNPYAIDTRSSPVENHQPSVAEPSGASALRMRGPPWTIPPASRRSSPCRVTFTPPDGPSASRSRSTSSPASSSIPCCLSAFVPNRHGRRSSWMRTARADRSASSCPRCPAPERWPAPSANQRRSPAMPAEVRTLAQRRRLRQGQLSGCGACARVRPALPQRAPVSSRFLRPIRSPRPSHGDEQARDDERVDVADPHQLGGRQHRPDAAPCAGVGGGRGARRRGAVPSCDGCRRTISAWWAVTVERGGAWRPPAPGALSSRTAEPVPPRSSCRWPCSGCPTAEPSGR